MGIYDDMLKHNESLFRNEYALDYSFLPKAIPYRESQQKFIASCIKPLINDHNGRNVLIHGPPGVGKTAALRHLVKELNESDEFSDKLSIIFVNCWHKNTTYKVVLDLCDEIGYAFVQNKNTEDLIKILAQIINKKSAIFIFDEIDKAEDTDFLYILSEQIYRKSIFLVTNYKSWMLELDDRIRSRLMLEQIEFPQYTKEEMFGILKQRVELALQENCINDNVIGSIALKASELKDIRIGLFLLRESALIAEEKASRQIKQEHVDIAITKINQFTIKNTDELDEEAKNILKIIKDNSGKKIGDLFKVYEKAGGKSSYKTFQRKINKLDEGKFISLERTYAGGNTTIVNKKLTEY
ncbi:TPA: AAA family ATPase [Candidatus Woesearchaeota archaeon]|nr:AAA family ATPase [Candidatus Woesearchaeota archaeon]HIH31357.1 AAA family ATPase [Candidatus Woesearchaeota archaeon]HIH54582.1 AAA family ATPase [Candidatus Woesearchaeota archaeon]HIJ02364.1 AAA family ATPase [Candidatus Woesearchaeota archaeon]HIJ14158.1 AAA family ATPase [Candidatus Woesearchaeota archaeon]